MIHGRVTRAISSSVTESRAAQNPDGPTLTSNFIRGSWRYYPRPPEAPVHSER